MSHFNKRHLDRYLALARQHAHGPALEWEELPSLAHRLERAEPGRPVKHVPWDATMPAVLEPVIESDPFSEPLDGVSVRELREPDVFRHFFA